MSSPSFGKDAHEHTISAQAISLAPNAGGQVAYAVRYAKPQWEAGIFRNNYLLAGDAPLTGGTLSWHLPMCGSDCWWQVHTNLGLGFATTGPIAEISWSALLPLLPIWLPTGAPRFLPLLRVDLTTQFLFFEQRHITWSYPLWAGLAFSF
jgi:hypothetical protein